MLANCLGLVGESKPRSRAHCVSFALLFSPPHVTAPPPRHDLHGIANATTTKTTTTFFFVFTPPVAAALHPTVTITTSPMTTHYYGNDDNIDNVDNANNEYNNVNIINNNNANDSVRRCGLLELDASLRLLPRVRRLSLAHNRLSRVDFLQDCGSLEELDLSHNRLE